MSFHNKELLEELANETMIYLEESDYVNHIFTSFLLDIKKLEMIDTTNVKPLIYPIEDVSYLRDDEICMTPTDILKDHKHKKDNYVVIPRVVK